MECAALSSYLVNPALAHPVQGLRIQLLIALDRHEAHGWPWHGLMKLEQREKLQREIVGATCERMLREIADALQTITAESSSRSLRLHPSSTKLVSLHPEEPQRRVSHHLSDALPAAARLRQEEPHQGAKRNG